MSQCLSPEATTLLQEELNKLLDVEADSLVCQECKQALINDDDDTKSPILIYACGLFSHLLSMYEKGDHKSYRKFVTKTSKEFKKSEKIIENTLVADFYQSLNQYIKNNNYLNHLFKISVLSKEEYENNILNNTFRKEVLKGLHNNIILSIKKTDNSIYKKCMEDSDFEHINYLIQIICKELNKPELTQIEQEKVVTGLKQFDNK